MLQFILKINLGKSGSERIEENDIATILQCVANELVVENKMYIGERRTLYFGENIIGKYEVKNVGHRKKEF
jgi:hypothetical protein